MRFLVLICGGVLLACNAGRSDELRVGDYGDPGILRVTGCQHFDSAAVESALRRDFGVLQAGNALASFDKYIDVLQQRVLEGYRHAGFADAWATTTFSVQQRTVDVCVVEGARYAFGKIVIEGHDQLAAEALQHALTEPFVPPQAIPVTFAADGQPIEWVDQDGSSVSRKSELWDVGEPARVDAAYAKALQERVKDAIAAVGFYGAVFTTQLRVDKASASVDYIVRFQSEGSRRTVSSLTIRGNVRHSTDDIAERFQLAVGRSYSQAEHARIVHAFWKSGRFLDTQVSFHPDDSGAEGELRVEVDEYKNAPLLGAPLTREQHALLKCQEWLLDHDDLKTDWILTLTNDDGEEAEVVISHDGQYIILFGDGHRTQPSI